jgi:hypothetical protein
MNLPTPEAISPRLVDLPTNFYWKIAPSVSSFRMHYSNFPVG